MINWALITPELQNLSLTPTQTFYTIKYGHSQSALDHIFIWKVVKPDTLIVSPPLFLSNRKSKEEYDEEMSRKLLLEEDLGSTSACSSQPDKPAAESGEAQNTTSVRSQRGSCAKVRRHKLYKPETTCGATETTCGCAQSQSAADICGTCNNNTSNLMLVTSFPHSPTLPLKLTLSSICCLFHAKAKAEEDGSSSSTNAHNTPLVNGNTATELNPVTQPSQQDRFNKRSGSCTAVYCQI